VNEEAAVDTTFAHHNIDSIIHFAELKVVGESVEKTPGLKGYIPTRHTIVKIIIKNLRNLVLLIYRQRCVEGKIKWT